VEEIFDREMFDQLEGSHVPSWIGAVVAAASVATCALGALGQFELARYADGWQDAPGVWIHAGLGVALAIVIALCWLPPSRGSRILRAAALLPIVHLVAIAGAAIVWWVVLTSRPSIARDTALLADTPFLTVIGAVLAGTSIVGFAIAPRRSGEWSATTTMYALVQLLLVGLWLPIAAELFASNPYMVPFTLVVPVIVALVFTALATRDPALVRAHIFTIVTALAILVATSACVGLGMSDAGAIIYANLAPVVFAFLAVAVAALTTLAVARVAAGRSCTTVVGTIACSHRAVAFVENAGWLRGVRATVRAFELVTEVGRVPIPAGAALVWTLPPSSMRLATSEALAIIENGDRVAVGGLVEIARQDPFRTATTLVPGTHGVSVHRERPESLDFADIAVAIWRPCLAYVAVVATISVPAVLALVAAI
jgi:hypothetical protein